MIDRERLFWLKVNKTENGCWEWTACKLPSGYGRFTIGNGVSKYAHRYSYELAFGSIPEGLTIDHLCRNRSCVNPAHLEAVTLKENTLRGTAISADNARKTVCKHSHPLNDENTYVYHRKDGRMMRMCKICREQLTNQWNEHIKSQRPEHAPKAICKHGHPFDDDNTYVYHDAKGQAKRACKTCKTIRAREKYRLVASRQVRS